jgi:hypothetical protein
MYPSAWGTSKLLNCLMLRVIVSDQHPTTQPVSIFEGYALCETKPTDGNFQLAVKRDFGQGLTDSCNSRDGGRVASGPPTDRLSSMGAGRRRRTIGLNINPSRLLLKLLLGFGVR